MVNRQRELLNICLITYNRANHLDNTLRQLIKCPFSIFPITIIDNCSTDSTYEVFLRYKGHIPTLNYVKNKVNIGADANVLRGVELSEGLYTWILADDDEYDFTCCDDVLTEIARGDVAAIMVGWTEKFLWPEEKICDTPINLINKNFPYFGVATFVPGCIFKTDLFQNQIRNSYTNIVNLYPAMTYYIMIYEENRLVHICHHRIVNAAANAPYHYSFLRVLGAIVNTLYLIDSPAVRRKTLHQVYPDIIYKTFIDHTLMMREPESPIPGHTIFRYFLLLGWKRKLLFLVAYFGAPIVSRSIGVFRYFKNFPH